MGLPKSCAFIGIPQSTLQWSMLANIFKKNIKIFESCFYGLDINFLLQCICTVDKKWYYVIFMYDKHIKVYIDLN